MKILLIHKSRKNTSLLYFLEGNGIILLADT